ncbi:MAG: BTAD domain-containing putative transcriptional regulator [Hyphomicrobiaceae bacterium]
MKITTVGRLEMWLGGRPIMIGSRKARALLGYLLVYESHQETREYLVGLLWSESDGEKARGSLRHCLKEIRLGLRGTKFSGLQLDNQTLGFDPASVTVDLWDILEQAKRDEVHPKLLEIPNLTDQLLKDVETVDPVFRTWLLARRQSLNQRLISNFERILEGAVVGSREGENAARAILNLDATNEVACRHLMRCRSAQDDIGGALKIYTDFWELLDREYDVEPTEQTQALFAELKAALPLTGPPDAVPKSPPSPAPVAGLRPVGTKLVLSIAPFEAAAIPSSRRYLVQGFRSELIAHLTRFREWMVRERPAGGERLDVADEYVLQAETLPFKKGARLTLSLRECATDGYLWGDGVNLDSVDWGEAQISVMRRIAAALNIHVSAGRLAQIGPKSPSDMIAYDLWLRGQNQQLPHESSGYENAEALYRNIIVRHPNFAPAYSSLAQLQNSRHFINPGQYRDPRTQAEALRFASESVRLDPMDSRSQLCLGWANAMTGLHDQAEVHHRLAAELNDSDAWTLISAALGSAFRSETAAARELADRSAKISLQPSPAQWRYAAMVHYLNGDYRECLHATEEAKSSIQNVLVWRAACLVQLDRVSEARAAADEFFAAAARIWARTDIPPLREHIARWFLQAFPIKHEDAWTRLRDDFGRAGAPVEGIRFPTLSPSDH